MRNSWDTGLKCTEIYKHMLSFTLTKRNTNYTIRRSHGHHGSTD